MLWTDPECTCLLRRRWPPLLSAPRQLAAVVLLQVLNLDLAPQAAVCYTVTTGAANQALLAEAGLQGDHCWSFPEAHWLSIKAWYSQAGLQGGTFPEAVQQ